MPSLGYDSAMSYSNCFVNLAAVKFVCVLLELRITIGQTLQKAQPQRVLSSYSKLRKWLYALLESHWFTVCCWCDWKKNVFLLFKYSDNVEPLGTWFALNRYFYLHKIRKKRLCLVRLSSLAFLLVLTEYNKDFMCTKAVYQCQYYLTMITYNTITKITLEIHVFF